MTQSILDAAGVARLRATLQARLDEIAALDQENRAAGAVVELDQQSVGRLSRMDALERQSMALATRRRREAERQRIDAALKRIARDEFGDCTVCGDPIATARLELDPTVTRCVDCASG